jgi:hypothetical protein
MGEKMKPSTQWKLSTKIWTLRDMLASETIRKGPRSPMFAHAIYDLIKGRIDDPDVSDEDIQNLTTDEVGKLSGRIAEKMIESLRVESAITRMSSMIGNTQKESKPS